MKVIEALNKADKCGILRTLLHNGLISSKVIFYREIYLLVDKEVRLGNPKMVAYQFASDKFKVTIKTIQTACKVMSE